MKRLEHIKNWYRSGFWIDTPQGVCLLLSVPICGVASVASFVWPTESRPLFLDADPIAFLLTPIVALLYFVWFGQSGPKQYSSSLLNTVVVLTVVGMPFYVPYIQRHTT